MINGAGKATFGRGGDYASLYFNGKIDNPVIYNDVRSAAEVLADYNAGLASGDAYIINTTTTQGSSGNLLKLQNNGTDVFTFGADGEVIATDLTIDTNLLVTDSTANTVEVVGELITDAFTGAIQTVTASSDTLDGTDFTTLCDCTSNAITITLPASSGATGRLYNIKKIDATGNTVTIDGNSAETIDGSATITLTTQYESVTIQCDGSNWHII
jgi:hypothetical protein